jgi:DNA-binding NtrC family response regulator
VKTTTPKLDSTAPPPSIVLRWRAYVVIEAGYAVVPPREVDIDNQETRIGRQPRTGVTLNDDSVSRIHASLLLGKDNSLRVADHNSRWQTIVCSEEGDVELYGGEAQLDSGYWLLVGESAIVVRLEKDEPRAAAHGECLGVNHSLRRALHLLGPAVATADSVLLLGETGSGKDVVASLIHRTSPRAAKPFFALNCATLSPELAERELFGSVKGAYTDAVNSQGYFAAASGGTLFLDEVAELALPVQAKLLRVIENRELARLGSPQTERTNVRIVTATNKHLGAEIREGRFREDLYQRLADHTIRLPPLRDRSEDLFYLLDHLLEQQHGRDNRSTRFKFTRDLIRALRSYPWPGNVRELRRFAKKLSPDKQPFNISFIPMEEFASIRVPELRKSHKKQREARVPSKVPPREELERIAATAKSGRDAAAKTGIQKDTLIRLLHRLGITNRWRLPKKRVRKKQAGS